MNDEKLRKEALNIMAHGGYSFNVAVKLNKIIAKVEAKTIEAVLAAVEAIDSDGDSCASVILKRHALAAIKGVGDDLT